MAVGAGNAARIRNREMYAIKDVKRLLGRRFSKDIKMH